MYYSGPPLEKLPYFHRKKGPSKEVAFEERSVYIIIANFMQYYLSFQERVASQKNGLSRGDYCNWDACLLRYKKWFLNDFLSRGMNYPIIRYNWIRYIRIFQQRIYIVFAGEF